MSRCRTCGGRPVGALEVCRLEDRGSPSHEHVTPQYCRACLATAAVLLQVTKQLAMVVAPEEMHAALGAAGVNFALLRTVEQLQEVLEEEFRAELDGNVSV